MPPALISTATARNPCLAHAAAPHVPNEGLRYMLIGYARVSKADGSQSLDLQRDALRAEGINEVANLYHNCASGVRDDRLQ